jgi:hypothetical protein
MRIAISPDENPGDSGSVAADGTTERSVNVRVCLALLQALLRCGQDAWFFPNMTYQQRVAAANGDGTSLLVACAHNESTPGLSGTQFVFCPGGRSFGRQAAAADAVYRELAQLPGWRGRRGDVEENIYECCAFDRDTVYCEYLFMSPDDEPLWSASGYAERVAEATARGLAAIYGFTYVPVPVLPVPQPPRPPAQREEDAVIKVSRPDGQIDCWKVLHDGLTDGAGPLAHVVIHPEQPSAAPPVVLTAAETTSAGRVGYSQLIGSRWLGLLQAGYRGELAFCDGWGLDGTVWRVQWHPGDQVIEGPFKLTVPEPAAP